MTLASAPPAPYGVMPAGMDDSQWKRQQEYAVFRNILEGGDFTVNPWQRDIGGLATSHVISTAVANAVTYFADRWFAIGGASSEILMEKKANTEVPGFASAMKFSRKLSNADTAALKFGQVVSTGNSVRAQGQYVTLSFWAKVGANYSGGDVTVKVPYGTSTNDTAANLVTGSWAGQANAINVKQTLTTTMTRYSFTSSAVVPVTATQLGVFLTWTPVGTAGADDSITFHGFQLEIGSDMSDFEHRSSKTEMAMCQHYAYVIAEPASPIPVGNGMINGTNTQQITLPLPEVLRAAPTVTASVGSFKFNIAGTPTTATGFAAGSAHVPSAISIVGSTTATSGQATALQGGGGTGYIVASADF